MFGTHLSKFFKKQGFSLRKRHNFDRAEVWVTDSTSVNDPKTNFFLLLLISFRKWNKGKLAYILDDPSGESSKMHLDRFCELYQ